MAKIYGWVGKILRVDLSRDSIEEDDTLRYVPDYMGGRGLAARIAWEETSPEMGAFDAENPLMLMTGPFTGTTVPTSGRVSVSAVSPQAYPTEFYTRSNMGGRWGPELKYAGYDGIVVTGKASEPVYIWIHDDRVEIRPAKKLWGLGTYRTQELLMEEHGSQVRVVTMGQAGENLSRIAIINSETEAAAGQGGFGAVMGSKKLKAIAVRGTGGVEVADYQELSRVLDIVMEGVRHIWGSDRTPKPDPMLASKYGQRLHACTQQCPINCSRYYSRVPGVLEKGVKHVGQMHCTSPIFRGFKGSFYNWDIGFEAGFEVSKLTNDYGINHWDVIFGIAPWLLHCKEEGSLTELDGIPIDLNDPEFWRILLRKLSYREGIGDVLAEGAQRAADILGVGKELIEAVYPAWGSAGHWDGHSHAHSVIFPFWLTAALQWAMDSRDPYSSGHGYAENLMFWSPFLSWGVNKLTWEEIAEAGAKVYGVPKATDVRSGYEDKAEPAVFHGDRSVLKDSLPVCDYISPRIYNKHTEDHVARAGGMEGPSFEYHIFLPLTGLQMSEEEFNRAFERIFTLERAILVRNNGRSRQDDESIIPYLERPELWTNPFLGEPQRLDRKKFLRLMDEYYQLRGWDKNTARPLRAKFEELGLKDVADDLEGRGLSPG